jgi:predicted nucleic acid-binding protein
MARSEQPSPVVLDTSVLSNFALTDDLDLLGEIPARFVTVEAVDGELRTGIERGCEFLGRAIGAVEVIDIEGEPGDDLDSLDWGESYAIQAAREQDGTIVLDDGPARDRADDLGVPLTGSIGLMIRLVRDGTISEAEANEIHRWWIEEGRFRSPVESITEALERID